MELKIALVVMAVAFLRLNILSIRHGLIDGRPWLVRRAGIGMVAEALFSGAYFSQGPQRHVLAFLGAMCALGFLAMTMPVRKERWGG